MNSSAVRVSALVGCVVAGLVGLLLVWSPRGHQIVVKAYFSNAMGLRPGARVRLAGIDIGSVTTVRARPEMKEAPAEVLMALTPSYELKIPNDSTATLSTAGILGETYVAIDASHASGAPIGANAVLHTIPTTQLSTHEMLEKLGDIMSKHCDGDSSGDTTVGKKISKN